MMPPLSAKSALSREPFYNPAHARLLLLTLVLVGMTTWALLEMQNALQAREHGIPLRPFTIGYLIPLFIITSLGGKRFGRLAVGLSVLLGLFFLTPPEFTFALARPRDWAELTLLVLVGESLIRGLDSIQRDMALREDVEQSPFTASLIMRAKESACHISGVESVGQCILRRRGIEYYLDVDVFVNGALPLREADKVAHGVQEALYGIYSLIHDVRVRLRPTD